MNFISGYPDILVTSLSVQKSVAQQQTRYLTQCLFLLKYRLQRQKSQTSGPASAGGLRTVLVGYRISQHLISAADTDNPGAGPGTPQYSFRVPAPAQPFQIADSILCPRQNDDIRLQKLGRRLRIPETDAPDTGQSVKIRKI